MKVPERAPEPENRIPQKTPELSPAALKARAEAAARARAPKKPRAERIAWKAALIVTAVCELSLVLAYLASFGEPTLPMVPAMWNAIQSVFPGPAMAVLQLGPPTAAWSVWIGVVMHEKRSVRRAAALRASGGRPGDVTRTARLLRELRAYALPLSVLLIVSLVAVPLALITPWPLKIIVDNVIGTKPLSPIFAGLAPSPSAVTPDFALTIAIAILLGAGIVTYVQNLANIWLTNWLGNRMTVDMRVRLFRQLQRLSILYHDTKGTGDSTYRIQYDAMWLSSMTTDGLIPVITDLLTVTGYLAVTLVLDWELALIALLVTPVMFLLTVVYRRRMKLGWKKVKLSESAAMSAAQESLSASRIVKAFGQEERENTELLDRYERTAKATLRVMVQGGVYGMGLGIITAVGMAAVFILGVRHVQSNILTLGQLIVVSSYLTALYSPLKDMGKNVLNMQLAVAGRDRFLEILDEKPDVPEKPRAKSLAHARGRIEFRDVSFAYDREQRVLNHVSFTLPAGKRLGVVGPTGSGKTTLSSLMLRFFDPTEGSITLDGVDVKDYKVGDLRNQFGVVLQDTMLFSTSIAENIRFAKPDATLEEVIAAAKAANAHDFIMSLPDDYDTLVGDRGMKLSGGERQRISIARAFLKDAPILILDEPTSSLDVPTEREILDSLRDLMKGRTTVMIAHRASTLRDCDSILILDRGRMAGITDEVAPVLEDMASAAIGVPGRASPSGGVE